MAEFLCASCGKTFFRKAALQQHNYQVHKHETCACNECGKILTSKKKLANHLSSHEKIKCIGCDKTIPKNSKSSHDCGEQNETFKCDQCPYETKQKGHLLRHMKVHNKKEKEKTFFDCNHFGKTFNPKDNMIISSQ